MAEVRRSARRRRWLFWGAMVFAFLGIPGLCVLYLLWDGEHPQDADLLEPAVTVPREQNGVFCLSDQEAAVDWGDLPRWKQDMAFTVDWDPKLAADLLEKNAAAIEKVEAALRAPDFRFPTGEEVALLSSMEWRVSCRLLQIRAHQRLESGRLREALEDALRIVRLGERIQAGGGVLVFFLSGFRFRWDGWGTIEELIARGRPSREESEWLDRELSVPFRWRDGLAATLRAEYGFISKGLDDPNLDTNLDPFNFAGEKPVIAKFLGPALNTRLFCNRELTRRLIVEGFRTAIADVLGGAVTLSPDLPALWWGPIPAKNYQGKLLCRAVLVGFANVVERAHKAEFRPAAVRTLLALRRYQIEKRSLPASLEELVPGYLPEVPRSAEGVLVGYDRKAKLLFDPRQSSKDPERLLIEFEPPLRPSNDPEADLEGMEAEEAEEKE